MSTDRTKPVDEARTVYSGNGELASQQWGNGNRETAVLQHVLRNEGKRIR